MACQEIDGLGMSVGSQELGGAERFEGFRNRGGFASRACCGVVRGVCWKEENFRRRVPASAHSWVVWASWRDRCWFDISLLEFVCVSLLVV
jgi:hypothetical protein